MYNVPPDAVNLIRCEGQAGMEPRTVVREG